MQVPQDVLPVSSPASPEDGQNQPPVIPDVVPPVVPPVTPVPPVSVPPVQTPPAPGSKTPEENLLIALQKERDEKKILEDKLLALTSQPPVTEAFSDEGKMLESKIATLEAELSSVREEKVLEAIQVQHPVLRELAGEFSQYKAGFPGVAIERVAKLFLNEKGLLDASRKGLERPAGAGGNPPSSDKLTAEEVSDLRKNNHKKYTEMLMNGKIRLDELS